MIDHPSLSSLRLRRLKFVRYLGSRVGTKRADAGTVVDYPLDLVRVVRGTQLCFAACTWSSPLIQFDHDVSLPASFPLRVRLVGEVHLMVGFAAYLVACQHTDNFPGYVPSGPPDGLRSPKPYAPGVGAPDHRFFTPPPSPRYSRAGLVLHMAQAISTTQTTRLPRAVSTGSTSF